MKAYNKRTMLKKWALTGCALSAIAAPALAQDFKTYAFDIDRKDLGAALTDYGIATGHQVLFKDSDVSGKAANEVEGVYTSMQAVQLLLNDTGVEYRIDDNGTLLVGAEYVRRAGMQEEAGSFRVVALAQENAGAEEPLQEVIHEEDDIRVDDTIIVTGTNIRGIAAESSPTRTFTREDIDATGAATAQEFIQTLSSNFSGGSNPNIPGGLPNDAGAGGNTGAFGSYGSSVNLRGLGSGSTLVLLNGRRIAPAAVTGDFADISMIPASAIERVETLTDGASSIYGSDAVAGVVNFVLRDDFDGLEASARYGVGTEEHSPSQYRASVAGGTNWVNGNGLFVYEYFSQDELSIDDRAFAPTTFSPSFLLPSQERHSVLGSLNHNLASNLEFSTDFTFSERDSRSVRTDISGNTFQYDANSNNLNVSAGLTWSLSGAWYVDLNGNYSNIATQNQSSIFSENLRETDSAIWVGDAVISGPLFSLPAGEVRVALGGHYREEDLQQTVKFGNSGVIRTDRNGSRNVYAIYGEAFIPLIGYNNRFPMVQRLEFNVSGRWEEYNDFGDTFDPKVGLLLSPLDGLNLRGSYSTSFKAPVLGRVGAVDRSASVLMTDFINQIFGLTSPDPLLDAAVVITRSGTAEKLKPETSEAITIGVDFSKISGRHSINASSSYFDIDFKNRLGLTPIPGNLINFAAVNLAFTNPEAFPAGTVVFNPTVDEISDVLNGLDLQLGNPFGLDPFDAVAINNVTIVRNLSRTLVRGFDFDISYSYELDSGDLSFGVDGTHILSFERQATTSSPVVDQVNTLFNPASTKIRGRIGYQQDNLSANLFLNYVNDYKINSTTSSETVSDWITLDASLTYSFPESVRGSALENVTLRVAALNIFNEDPPAIPINNTLDVDGYDPTNASPLGRFISFEISKKF